MSAPVPASGAALPRVAVLDDYEGVARDSADWSGLQGLCEIDFLDRKLAVPEEAAAVLQPYQVLCHLRERTPMPAALLQRLPELKFMTVTGKAHRTLDLHAAAALGISVAHVSKGDPPSHGAPELTWGLVLAAARHVGRQDRALRRGEWRAMPGMELHGKTLGLLGLGALGQRVAGYGRAFGMQVIAWSSNLTAEAAAEHGAARVTKEELFARSDVLSIHLVLGDRSRHLVGARELGLMKRTAVLVNTSRGPIIDQPALVAALQAGRIAAAGLDVFEQEPLPPGHPLLTLDNVVLTPHAGYVTHDTFGRFYQGTAAGLLRYLRGEPLDLLTP
jgi:phosphoglycerate dehydrogenase-like enzyme